MTINWTNNTPCYNAIENICSNYGIKDELIQTAITSVKTPTANISEDFIKKVEILGNVAVKITFNDGTFTKAVCNKDDTFDFDMGITICLIKKIMGESNFHRTVKKAKKIYKNRLIEEQKIIDEKKRKKEKYRKNQIRMDKKRAKRRNEQIEMMALAYEKALRSAGCEVYRPHGEEKDFK